MKKLLALLLALTMLFAFAACGEDEKEELSPQEEAEAFLDELSDLYDEYKEATTDNDLQTAQSVLEEITELVVDDFNDIYTDLYEDDKDDAKDFYKDVMAVTNKLGVQLDTSVDSDDDNDDADNKENAVITLPPTNNNDTDVEIKEDTKVEFTPSSITLEDFVESVQDDFEEAFDQYEQMGISLRIYARGNSLVYSCQFINDVGDTSTLSESLKSAILQQSSVFETLLSSLKDSVPSAESVIVEYIDYVDNVICRVEFD